MLRRGIVLLVLAVMGSCAPSARQGGFDSPNPAARMYAIEAAAREGDHSAIPRLIETLDADDPAVRMMAIATLERLTGRTYGYRYYDAPWDRREAIARWVEAYAPEIRSLHQVKRGTSMVD